MSKLPAPKGKRRFASLSEQIALRDVILAHSKPIDEDEAERVWHRGVRLDIIAQKVAPDLRATHVANVVKALGFEIAWPSQAEAPTMTDLEARIERLEAAFQRNGFEL